MKRSLLTVGCSDDVDDCVLDRASAGTEGRRNVIFVSADQANFHDTGNGVSMAAIWGDADKGAHATFTKFAPGYDAGMHTHTNDVWIVVLKGAYLYKDDVMRQAFGGGARQFPASSRWNKHWSGGDPKEGALFYEESPGKFDSIPAK